jgi:hypothetical protein
VRWGKTFQVYGVSEAESATRLFVGTRFSDAPNSKPMQERARLSCMEASREGNGFEPSLGL